MPDVELLKRARALIAPLGRWTTGRYHLRKIVRGQEVDAYCLLGALRVVGASDEEFRAVGELPRRLNYAYQDNQVMLIEYNDTPGRRKHEVIEALDLAIREASRA